MVAHVVCVGSVAGRNGGLAREMYEAGELTVAQIAAEFGVTRPNFYRHLERLDQLEQRAAAGEITS